MKRMKNIIVEIRSNLTKRVVLLTAFAMLCLALVVVVSGAVGFAAGAIFVDRDYRIRQFDQEEAILKSILAEGSSHDVEIVDSFKGHAYLEGEVETHDDLDNLKQRVKIELGRRWSDCGLRNVQVKNTSERNNGI